MDLKTLICKWKKPQVLYGPIRIQIPAEISEITLISLLLKEPGIILPGILSPLADGKAFLEFTLDKKIEGSKFTIEVQEECDQVLPPAVKISTVDKNTRSITIRGEEFTRFNYNDFSKSNRPCLFPVYSPCGVAATRKYPFEEVDGESHDHKHHTGVWTAWGEVNQTDNWASGPLRGRQKVKNITTSENSVYGTIDLDIDWVNPVGIPNLVEHRIIKIYSINDIRVVDFDILLTAKYGKVKFGDTKEGGFLSVRVPTPMDVRNGGKIENGKGKVSSSKLSERKVWGKRAEWCDYSGIVEGKKIGITIFDTPGNVNYPTYWHVRNYGLMTANPFGLSYFIGKRKNGTLRLKKGETLRFKYRLVVHNGDAKDAGISDLYRIYIGSPEVSLA